ncbi:hypothetical protein C5B94_15390 [Clavibacter michiganensis]|uniref:hypothetical protein n=1 Tax=Clavibacter michiganensis TaxID=28447 RepID=UPI000CE8F157|nr:hypothetical protein [Clavibacter michiganensis]PPF50340.1 hypothetical protein C5B94_15390 [Clavibacter michiganensis]
MRGALTARERHLAAEIRAHDWSEAPYRASGTAHAPAHAPSGDDSGSGSGSDGGSPGSAAPRLSPEEAERVRVNVMWVVAQCLGYEDPEFNPDAFAEAAGITRDYRCTPFGGRSAIVREGLRVGTDGSFDTPGSGPRGPRGPGSTGGPA